MDGRTALLGTLVTSLWTLVSRVLGFVRDALMAAFLGVTPLTGAFAIAWVVPNLFRRLFGEGAVGAAVQPALARAREEGGEEAARRLYARFQGFQVVLLLGVLVVGEGVVLGARILSPAPDPAWDFLAVLLPYVVPICMCALAAAPQQLSGSFFRPALAPALLNVLWITLLVVLHLTIPELDRSVLGLQLLCAGILLGGFLQWGLQLPGVRAAGYPVRPELALGDPRVRAAVLAFAPALLGLAAIQLNFAVDQLLVRALVDDAANTYTWLANRLLQLPLALVGLAAATGTLPLFARLAAQGRFPEMAAAIRRTCESTLLVIVAAAAGLHALAVPVIQVLFEHGRFTPEDTLVLAATLRAYLWGLPAAALASILTRARQARGDVRGPAWIGAGVVPLNLILDVLLLPRLGVPGAGWATSATLLLQASLLAAGLRDLGLRSPVSGRRLPRLLLPGLAAGATAAAVRTFLGPALAGALPGLAFAIAAGAAAFLLLARLLLPEEAGALVRALRRR